MAAVWKQSTLQVAGSHTVHKLSCQGIACQQPTITHRSSRARSSRQHCAKAAGPCTGSGHEAASGKLSRSAALTAARLAISVLNFLPLVIGFGTSPAPTRRATHTFPAKGAANEKLSSQPCHQLWRLLLACAHAIGTIFCWPVIVGCFGAMATTTFAMLMMQSPSMPPSDVFTVPFCLGSGVYAYDCLKDTGSANAAPTRQDQIRQNGCVYDVLMFCAAFFLTARLATWNMATISIVVPYLSIALLYPHKFVPLPVVSNGAWNIKWFGMKSIPLMKNFITPVMWAFGGSFLAEALLRQNGVHAIDIGARNATCLFFCLWDFATTTTNDCRDYFEDLRTGTHTIVTMIGIHASYMLAEALQVLIYSSAALAFFMHRPVALSILGLPFNIKREAVGIAIALAVNLPADIIPHIVQARNGFRQLSHAEQVFIEYMGIIKVAGSLSILPVFLAVSSILAS